MDDIPKRPRVQASRAAGSRRYTYTLIHNHAHSLTHARTHARTHTHTHTHTPARLIRDREAQDGHLDFHTAP